MANITGLPSLIILFAHAAMRRNNTLIQNIKIMQNTTSEPDDRFLINYGVYLFNKELEEGLSFLDITTNAKYIHCRWIHYGEDISDYYYDKKICELICKELEVFGNCFPFADIVGEESNLKNTFKDCHLLKALYKEGLLPIEKKWVIRMLSSYYEYLNQEDGSSYSDSIYDTKEQALKDSWLQRCIKDIGCYKTIESDSVVYFFDGFQLEVVEVELIDIEDTWLLADYLK